MDLKQAVNQQLFNIRNNVLLLMREFKLSAQAFSRLTEIPAPTIYNYLKDTSGISLANLIKISIAFKILPERLIATDGSLYDVIDKLKKDEDMIKKIKENKKRKKVNKEVNKEKINKEVNKEEGNKDEISAA